MTLNVPAQSFASPPAFAPPGKLNTNIPAGDDPDLLWSWLELTLGEALGISGIFYVTYPVGDSAGSLEAMLERAIWRTSYPETYLAALKGNILSNDRSSNLVLHLGHSCKWNDPLMREGATPGELRRLDLDREHEMHVGACVPVYNGAGTICGGFGLRSLMRPEQDFYDAFDVMEPQLAEMLARFDRQIRGPLARRKFRITPQERRVLAHVAGGMSVDRTADALNLSSKTVEAYLRSARTKTRSGNTAEAIAKALFFNMI